MPMSLVAIPLLLGGCLPWRKIGDLHLILDGQMVYQCEESDPDFSTLSAQYFSLSDGSLGFVKIIPSSPAQTFSLARTSSASGAKYSNGTLAWWIKGETGNLRVIDGKNNSLFLAKSCSATKKLQ